MKKTLTKADIVEAIYEETDKNRVDVKQVVEKLLEIMKGATIAKKPFSVSLLMASSLMDLSICFAYLKSAALIFVIPSV